MALSAFPDISKSIKLDDGTRYAYAHIKPATASQPTFLFLHGFPSSSYDWRHQIAALKSKGFGILAPDLLGYGDTDSPAGIENYTLKRMSGHVAEILAKEGIKKVIGVGHDWGSAFLSRFHTWHSELLIATVFISVGYVAPSGTPLDLDGLNALTQQLFGYPTFGYWKLFDTEEAGQLLDNHPDSTASLIYPEDPETWKAHLAPIGAAEAWISSNKITPPPTWLTAEEVAIHKKTLAQKGYTGPLNWYKAAIRGCDAVFEASVPEEQKHISIPTLLVGGEKDFVTRPDMQKQGTEMWAKQLRVENFSCGHWVQLEVADKLNDLLVEFASGL